MSEVKQLKRELNLTDAVLLGLGSILGTGIFVSIGVAAGITGPSVIVAVLLAAFLATANALSSAQLAAAHAVSGGTYEYGYKFLTPLWGFLAGWIFLLAKSASAATAALGLAGYSLKMAGLEGGSPVLLAVAVVVVLTSIVYSGAKKTSRVNSLMVTMTVIPLAAFVLAGLYSYLFHGQRAHESFFWGDGFADGTANLFEATALMFVAYTGYGRVATLAEEVAEPQRIIPKAIILVLAISGGLYALVALVGVVTVGADHLASSTRENAAPLSTAASTFGVPFLPVVVAIGAATAMLSVLVNLILGLSRVTLAMGRRGDLPLALAKLDKSHVTPVISVLVVGVVIALLTMIGNLKVIWSFSAFTVLLYYAITNAAALAMPPELRTFPRWVAWSGLASCLFLVLFIDRAIWISGGSLVLTGLVWYIGSRWIKRQWQAA